MSTADDVRRQWWISYWRTRENQLLIQQDFIPSLAALLGKKMREVYPDLAVPNGDKQDAG